MTSFDIEELKANIEEVKKLLMHAKKLEELVDELQKGLKWFALSILLTIFTAN